MHLSRLRRSERSPLGPHRHPRVQWRVPPASPRAPEAIGRAARPQGERALLSTPAERCQPRPGTKEPTSTHRTSSELTSREGHSEAWPWEGQAGGEPERGGGGGPRSLWAIPQARRPQELHCEPQLPGQTRSRPCAPMGGAGGPRDSPVHAAARPEQAAGPPRLVRPLAAASPPLCLCSPPVQVCAGPGAHWGPRLPASPPGPGPREDSTGILQSQVLTAFERTGRAR